MTAPFLNLLVLRAPDIEKAQRFYSLLGFAFTRHAHGSGPPHYAADTGAQVFEIYPQTGSESSTSNVRIGFRVANIETAISRLVARGAKLIATPKESPFGRRAVVSDPFGHTIELTELEAAAAPSTS